MEQFEGTAWCVFKRIPQLDKDWSSAWLLSIVHRAFDRAAGRGDRR
jgi:hypothetical protein